MLYVAPKGEDCADCFPFSPPTEATEEKAH